MTRSQETVIADKQNFRLILVENEDTIEFLWKRNDQLSATEFQQGILSFAQQCQHYAPNHALIDATLLDPQSQAIMWLRDQIEDQTIENYDQWWNREIVPLYHKAKITHLAIGTGDPNAPGELPAMAPDIRFRMGYFPDLSSARSWATSDG